MNTKSTRVALGCLTVTRVITDRIPLIAESRSEINSVGQMIDEHLARAAAQGESVQTVRLDFEQEQWESIAVNVYQGYVE